MTVQIPLRAKYRNAVKGRYKGGEKPAPKKSRKKIGFDAHVARFGIPRKITRIVDGRGKGRCRDAS